MKIFASNISCRTTQTNQRAGRVDLPKRTCLNFDPIQEEIEAEAEAELESDIEVTTVEEDDVEGIGIDSAAVARTTADPGTTGEAEAAAKLTANTAAIAAAASSTTTNEALAPANPLSVSIEEAVIASEGEDDSVLEAKIFICSK